MSDILGKLAGLGQLGPELMIQMLGMIIDGIGTGTEWTGEQLDQIGEMAQTLADKIRGIQEQAAE